MSENGEPGTVDPRDVNNVINQYLPPGSTFRDNEGKVVDPAVVGAVNKWVKKSQMLEDAYVTFHSTGYSELQDVTFVLMRQIYTT